MIETLFRRIVGAGKAMMFGGCGTSVCTYAVAKTEVVSAPSTYFMGLTATEIAAFGSLAVAVIGMLVSSATTIWYRRRQLKMMAEDIATRKQ